MKRRLSIIIVYLSVSGLFCLPGPIIAAADCGQAVKTNRDGAFHQESFGTITDESSDKLKFTHPNGGVKILIKDPLKVTYPNGHQKLIKGRRYTIMWHKGSSDLKYVYIHLLQHGKKRRIIAKRAYNDESFNWRVPKNLETCSGYQIGVYHHDVFPYFGDTSDNYFAIRKKGDKSLVGTWSHLTKWSDAKKYRSETLYMKCDKTVYYKDTHYPRKWGTWKRVGSKVTLRERYFRSGIYKGKKKSDTFMRGTMRSHNNKYKGKWHARRKSIFIWDIPKTY